jgi:hypothetical protein
MTALHRVNFFLDNSGKVWLIRTSFFLLTKRYTYKQPLLCIDPLQRPNTHTHPLFFALLCMFWNFDAHLCTSFFYYAHLIVKRALYIFFCACNENLCDARMYYAWFMFFLYWFNVLTACDCIAAQLFLSLYTREFIYTPFLLSTYW